MRAAQEESATGSERRPQPRAATVKGGMPPSEHGSSSETGEPPQRQRPSRASPSLSLYPRAPFLPLSHQVCKEEGAREHHGHADELLDPVERCGDDITICAYTVGGGRV